MPHAKKEGYPQSMKNLTGPVKDKAMDIAGALEEEKGMPEGRAIAIGTAQAEKWGERRGMAVKRDGKEEDSGKKQDKG